ncbi:uncharacterized protein N7446_006148 [Penicillium canescens]|uniref:Uncharacterized protein n=1 Tax=Penicillium canescens TaxID=5083 RepID=A0AAD6IKH0_PENCN|nr:uncharacterized protein N7446_006148 [Penicillium canescens]KAJ6051515.1 hypothetical protein N7460_002049 [Penicillium canescens]KAJ6062028.1 hypothetical protein N7446_006148 [Penicillium canescens]KAJ6065278.1 hypothetical protein N7444_000931 [Penicillium canescens]
MPKPAKNTTVWRENRRKRGSQPDPHKRIRADRMRWYRAKRASFKKANDIFVDGLDTGCDRRVYVLVMSTKQSQVRYATYDSHPELEWIPNVEDVMNHWPRPELWDPSSFDDTQQQKETAEAKKGRTKKAMRVSRPPILKI